MVKRRWLAGAGVVGTMVVAGALGPVVFGAGAAGAKSNSSSSSSSGVRAFHSNEDPAHEQGESAAREKAEDSGQFRPGGRDGHHGFGSNEDPAHEQGESAEREQAEGAPGSGGQGTTTPAPSTSGI
jgi:hypothetical protein